MFSDNIKVYTNDAVFGRMLELELGCADDGGRIVRGKAATVSVVDLDAFPSLPAVCDPSLTVGVTRRRDIADSLDPKPCAVLVRPFEIVRLKAVIGELVRLIDDQHSADGSSNAPVRPSERLTLEPKSSRAYFDSQLIDLTGREFDLLFCLYERRGEPLSRGELINLVWHYDFEGQSNIVDVYIRYLRAKLDVPFGVKLIETVRGKGYKMS